MFGIAFAIGFRSVADLARLLAAAGILLLFVHAISWLSAAIGLLARSAEAASGFTFFVTFLPYPSSGFVPIATMPWWLHGFAEHQPLTPITESVRGLLLGMPVDGSTGPAVAWCCGILAVSITVSGALARRRTG